MHYCSGLQHTVHRAGCTAAKACDHTDADTEIELVDRADAHQYACEPFLMLEMVSRAKVEAETWAGLSGGLALIRLPVRLIGSTAQQGQAMNNIQVAVSRAHYYASPENHQRNCPCT